MTEDETALRPLSFEFRATGGEYFRIWIVNLLLSIITLGVYSAWAKVRRLRYFHGSTYLDGHAFDYHAEPKAILLGRIVIVVGYGLFALAGKVNPVFNIVVLPLLWFGYPWVIMRSRRFHLRMTSWRGLRFGFHGDYKGAFQAYGLWNLLAVLSLGTLVPFYLQRSQRYQLDNTAYGSQRAAINVPVKSYYNFYARFAMQAFLMLLAATAVAGASSGFRDVLPTSALIVWNALVFIAAWLVLSGCFQANLLNLVFNNLSLGRNRFNCTMSPASLAFLKLSNFALIVITVGLYTPWAKVSLLRYQLDNLQVLVAGDLGEFTAGATADHSQALADEISDFFNVDFAI